MNEATVEDRIVSVIQEAKDIFPEAQVTEISLPRELILKWMGETKPTRRYAVGTNRELPLDQPRPGLSILVDGGPPCAIKPIEDK